VSRTSEAREALLAAKSASLGISFIKCLAVNMARRIGMPTGESTSSYLQKLKGNQVRSGLPLS